MHSEDISGKTLEHWTADDLHAAMADNSVVLIDVRTPQEYMFESIQGALLLPMASFDPAFVPPVADRPIVFQCGSGVRSRKVAEAYLAAGFDKVAHLEGGFAAWKAGQKPYMGTNMATGAPQPVGG